MRVRTFSDLRGLDDYSAVGDLPESQRGTRTGGYGVPIARQDFVFRLDCSQFHWQSLKFVSVLLSKHKAARMAEPVVRKVEDLIFYHHIGYVSGCANRDRALISNSLERESRWTCHFPGAWCNTEISVS